MIRIFSGWFLVAALLASSPMLQAADITITVSGRVISKPCTVANEKLDIDLGDIYTAAMSKAGSRTDWHNINLELRNCPAGTTRVLASFSGATDSGFYKNTGTASNIQLDLQDMNGQKMTPGASAGILVDAGTLSARLPLRIRALTVKGGVGQGTIKSVINVIYTYF